MPKSKEERLAYAKSWYERNKDRLKKRQIERYRTNVESRKAYQKARVRSLHGRYMHAKNSAKRRGIVWSLTENEYGQLISDGVCAYTALPLPSMGVGLDRLDNEKGYELGNVIPCSNVANVARGDFFSPEEMFTFIGPAIQAAVSIRDANRT